MLGPAVRRLSLGDLREQDIVSMVVEGESLFVEFKKGIDRGSGFQIAKAAASFANALGGWILVGVEAGEILPAWEAPTGDFVDLVRQRLAPHVDPLPSFSAGVREVDSRRVGVIRVYQSTDTPHILSDGSVVVREPAEDPKVRKLGAYEPAPVRSHYELLQLAQRGRDAQHGAQARFRAGAAPLVESVLGLTTPSSSGRRAGASGAPSVVVRFAPLTVDARWREWCVSAGAVREVADAIGRWVGDPDVEVDPLPFASGLGVETLLSGAEPWTPGAFVHVSRCGAIALDAGGVIGTRIRFDLEERSGTVDYHRKLTFDAVKELLSEIVAVGTDLLAASEHFGRCAMHADVFGIGRLFRIEPDTDGIGGGHSCPTYIPLGGDITVGTEDERNDADAVAGVWAREVLRSCGIAVWA